MSKSLVLSIVFGSLLIFILLLVVYMSNKTTNRAYDISKQCYKKAKH